MASRHLTHRRFSTFNLPSLSNAGKMLLLLTYLLGLMGLFFVFESSTAEAFNLFNDQYHFVKRQAIHFILGTIALGIGYFMPSHIWKKFAPLAYGLGILLLILVFIPGFGQEINGAYRWLFIGPINLQPIELVKLAMTLFFASWMSRHQRLLPFLFLTGLPTLLVMLQPDMGSTLVLLSIAASLYFMAGGQLKPFLGICAIGVIGISLAIILSPYRQKRLATFLNPESDPLGASFHIRQITLALGNGGIWGQGIGNSRQKFSYIPEASTDSIFSIVAEEVGFVGSCLIIFLYVAFFWFGFQILITFQGSSFERLVGVGVFSWLAAQTILNLAAVLAVVPLTGVPLPFFSYGGSSLIMLLFATGLLLHLAQEP